MIEKSDVVSSVRTLQAVEPARSKRLLVYRNWRNCKWQGTFPFFFNNKDIDKLDQKARTNRNTFTERRENKEKGPVEGWTNNEYLLSLLVTSKVHRLPSKKKKKHTHSTPKAKFLELRAD